MNKLSMTQKEIMERKETIETELEELFQAHMRITDWDVPEADDQKAAEMILGIFESKLAQIRKDVVDGAYKYF
ncbi:MAG: hypothetical protein PHF17_00505 [Arcobacteraceae bacterium]|nr:hypothetical protein [Arcobacteraceae bacterium]